MQLQRAQPSIVRSIRQISLVRDWMRSSHTEGLPHFSNFVPDERAGDAADLLIAEVRVDGDRATFYCLSAGVRVEQILDRQVGNSYVHESVDPQLALSAQPIWQTCLAQRMPVYSIVAITDRDGCPVTIEQLYLPYRLNGSDVGVIVVAVHAWSTEGRFVIQGLLNNLVTPPMHWAVIVDPALAGRPAGQNTDVSGT